MSIKVRKNPNANQSTTAAEDKAKNDLRQSMITERKAFKKRAESDKKELLTKLETALKQLLNAHRMEVALLVKEELAKRNEASHKALVNEVAAQVLKSLPEPEKTDLTPIAKRVDDIAEELNSVEERVLSAIPEPASAVTVTRDEVGRIKTLELER